MWLSGANVGVMDDIFLITYVLNVQYVRSSSKQVSCFMLAKLAVYNYFFYNNYYVCIFIIYYYIHSFIIYLQVYINSIYI